MVLIEAVKGKDRPEGGNAVLYLQRRRKLYGPDEAIYVTGELIGAS
jgi:hypothetical protein